MQRKSILNKITAILLCLMLIAAVAGCSGGTAKKVTFKSGSYTATAEGKEGPVKVKVTFSDSAITAIEILEQNESPSIGTPALNIVADDIKKNQSLSVDTVTGATYSSNTMLAVVEDCVKQAGADPALLKTNTK